MDGPIIFQFIGSFLDSALDAFVNVTAGNVITTFTLFALGATTLQFTLQGYSITFGYVEQPWSNFLKSCVKFILISAFALNADMYTEWIVGSIHSLEAAFTAAFTGADPDVASSTVYQVVVLHWAKAGASRVTYGKRPAIGGGAKQAWPWVSSSTP